MRFDALEAGFDLIRSLRAPVARIGRSDRKLAEQIRAAASSVSLNIAEARQRQGRDRRHLFRIAAGSAAETHAALRVAEAWGYVRSDEIAAALELLDRLQAMIWRLGR